VFLRKCSGSPAGAFSAQEGEAMRQVGYRGEERLALGARDQNYSPENELGWVAQLPQPTPPTSASFGTQEAPLPGKARAHPAFFTHVNSCAAKDPEAGLESWAARDVCTRRYHQVVEQLEEITQHV